jgi:PhnB protein
MSQINTYLTFNGNCREAMTFYQKCLGGDLTFQTIGESPLAEKMPPQMKEYILHSTLSKEALVLMGSDMVSEGGLIKGNNISIALDCESEEEMKDTYQNISVGGIENHPLELSFWGALFGDLTDKYDNHWILNFSQK